MLRIIIILAFLNSCISHDAKKSQIDINENKGIVQNAKRKILSDSTNTLEDKVRELKLEYIVWGCACANWITPQDRKKFPDSISDHCIFLEPADTSFNFQNYFIPEKHFVIVKGQFYKKPDYPKGTIQTEETLEKAKVFRFTEFRINSIDDKYKINTNIQTVTVSYNAIACTCAQWTESKYDNKKGDGKYIFLERENNGLLNADSLWDGEHLPLHLQLTGYFISESGYPKNYSPTKGSPYPAKVFQYNSIKIVSKKQ